jgi:integration host factor subunit beta
MNKLELIEKLKESHNITKDQATTIVNRFFDEMAAALARVIGLKSGAWVHCASVNINHTPATIRKLVKRSAVTAKKLPYFKCGQALRERVDR